MKTFRIIQSGARGNRCLVKLLTIALIVATSVQITIKSQVVVPQPCKLQTYMAKDDNAIGVSGTNSEVMAGRFDTVLAGMPGTRGYIDHEMLPVGNFSSMPLNSFVLAKLVNTGNPVTGNIEGIADSTSSSSGLGFNTTSGGDRHLQVYPLNNGPEGGVRLIFREDIFAFGCYISGREVTKRPVEAVITYRDGQRDILATQSGPYPGGGLQFFGFVSDCPVAEIYFVERYNGEAAGERDIFTLDDIRYVTHVEWPVEKCEAIRYSAHDDGPPLGGEPNPLAVGWDHPRSKGEQKRFLNNIASLGDGFGVDRVTFEADNGWAPVNGLGDLFIGASAPYSGTPATTFPYTLAAFGNTGSYPAGDATGYTEYYTAHSRLLFNVYMNGHNATIDEPGIGDMDGTNDADRGINTTPGGNHFLEILPSESFEGGFRLEFAGGTPAAGMYVQGTEAGKRRTSVTVDFLGGARRVYPDLKPGPDNVGGIEFLGFMAADISNRDCWIQAITFNQKWQGEPASERDIFSVDDIIYVIPGEDQPPPQGLGCINFDNLPLGKTYAVGDVFTWTSSDGALVINTEAVPFQWADGRMFSGGFAEVEDDGLAGVSGQDLEVNNINLVLTPAGGSVSELSFSFGEYGGNINFAVNGDRRNVNNFSDLNGAVIGGAQVTVPAGGSGNDLGHVIVTGLINEMMVGGQELYIDQICTNAEPPVIEHCVEFEDLNTGNSFSVGDRFNTANTDGSLHFEVEAFPIEWSDGTGFPGGTAMVGNNGMAGSSGNEMVVNNINLRFTSQSGPLPGLTFQFGEYGGNINFAVNGDARNVDNFQDLNGLTLGGVHIDVPVGGHGNDMGEVVLKGMIHEFTIGGQELFIDRICAGLGAPPMDPRKLIFAGRIIDGYIAGGTVFFDANFNGVHDEGEPATISDSKGHFELQIDIQTWDANMDGVIDSADGHLVVIGGVDIATGLPSRVKFSGPVGSTVLGPLSSLVDELLISQNGMSASDAVLSVFNSLGLPQGIDPLNFDPFQAAFEGDTNALAVMVKAAMLRDTVIQIASMFAAAQGQSPDEWAHKVHGAISRLLLADFNIDLTSEVTLLSLIQALNTEGETILDESQVNLLLDMILKMNRLKMQAVNSPENDIPGKVGHITRIQHVAQGQSVEILENSASGKIIPIDFLDDSNLDRAVEEAPSGDVFGTDTRPGTVSFQSASYLVNEDGSNLLALRLVRTDGNSGEVSVIIQRFDGSASAAGGDIMAGPWQGVFADGQTAIIVNLTDIIIDDAVPEGDESFTLRLALPDNSVDGLALGAETEVLVTIQDNDESAPEPDPATLTMSITHLTVSGTPGARYEILVSSDLKSWTLWKSVTLDNASGGQVSLPLESGRKIGFYAARPGTF